MRFATQPLSRSWLGRSTSVDEFVRGGESRPFFCVPSMGVNWEVKVLGKLVLGQDSIQWLIDRRVARPAPPMMDLLGGGLALQP